MEPILFVMAILGCGEGSAPCRQVAQLETRYRTEAACQAAAETELARRDELYPTIVAQCRRADARPQILQASDVALPEGGVLVEQPQRFASRSSR